MADQIQTKQTGGSGSDKQYRESESAKQDGTSDLG